jgi:ABC-2 type transport system permease protein
VNVRDVPVIIEDPNPSRETRELARAIEHSSLFRVAGTVHAVKDPRELFKGTAVRALFRFPPDFAARLRRPGSPASIQVLIDGSDQNLGTILRSAVGPFLQKATLELLHVATPVAITVDQTVLYNPQQKSAKYFVPGLMAIILMMISALLTSLTITKEKEYGTMEQLLISPLRPWEILIGKIAPYFILAAIDGIMIVVVGRVIFDVHVAGSLLLLAFVSTVYIFCALSLGLLVSTVSKRQEHAMLIVLPATMFPSILLSGFIFPLASLPMWLQGFAAVVPATYFLQIIRGIILKGVDLDVLWRPVAVLSGMGIFLLIVSIKKFQVKQ